MLIILLLTLGGFFFIIIDLLLIPGGFLVAAGTGMILYAIYLNFIQFGLIPATFHFVICLAAVPKLVIWALSRVALKEEMHAEDGYVGREDHSTLLGSRGRARTDLKPSGSVVISLDGGERFLDCISEGGFIEKGTDVVIVAERGPSLVVRKAPS